jgi:hypothetical protein
MEVPAAADVTLTGEYKPSAYRGGGFKKGVKPAETAPKPAHTALNSDDSLPKHTSLLVPRK